MWKKWWPPENYAAMNAFFAENAPEDAIPERSVAFSAFGSSNIRRLKWIIQTGCLESSDHKDDLPTERIPFNTSSASLEFLTDKISAGRLLPRKF